MTRIRVWDAALRLVHWALALLIPFSWWTQETEHMAWHRLSGYTVAALLVFRIWWGFAGPQTARFKGLLGGPKRIAAYLSGKGGATLGHNPLGGWSVAAMFVALTAQVSLGLFSMDEDAIEAGPLANFVSFDQARLAAHAHEFVFNVLLGLIALHLAAIAVYAARGSNLVRPMLTGRARAPDGAVGIKPLSVLALLVGLVLAGGVFALLLWLSKKAGL
ncbi:cytochrome b [Caulobacter ginsengisoli]|uniref:Cytochrome b n=1 Tax=Caulobacter ginsengisoli TaxID=400775 RepID=A0ABU0ISV5_9CAUL|nr:cytochrome b/b6 domain-containing protein [Caulobacter ginsengisoli]MDQ0464248.1 cytochrome b [Caulobacter ginsengisoli]